MHSRTLSILEVAIKEYIRTGKPVSSAELYKNNHFGIKPAMIRSELNQLTKAGFLEQPHTSGGRVPTDRGYQFLVDKMLDEHLEGLRRGLAVRRLVDREIHNIISSLSDELRLLSVGYESSENEVYKSGLGGLFEQLVFASRGDLLEVVRDIEMLDERMREMRPALTGDAPKVFIGKSPVTDSRQLSVVADKFNDGQDEFLLMVIGPKRMNYEKVIKLFKNLNR